MHTKFCSACGVRNLATAKYCYGCGDCFSDTIPQEASEILPKNKPQSQNRQNSKPPRRSRNLDVEDMSVEEAESIIDNIDEEEINNYFVQSIMSENSSVKGVKFEEVARGDGTNRKSLPKRKPSNPKSAKSILKETENKRNSNRE